MNKVLPSLSVDNGWVSDPDTIMQKLFEIFLSCDFSQSNYGDASSFKYILNLPDLEPVGRADAIKKSLENLYSEYFDSVTVTVDYETTDEVVVVYKVDIVAVLDGKISRLNESLSKNFYSEPNKFELKLDEVING